MLNTKSLFIGSFVGIIITYIIFLGIYRTIFLIIDQYLLLLAIVPIVLTTLYFKRKLKYFKMIDFIQNSQPSIKSTVGFFLVFQAVDFYYEDGFIGMISQWFLYWTMGIITVLSLNLFNYYKNYKLKKTLSL